MNKGTLARKVGLAALATLTAFAGLAPFAPGASAAANYTQVRYQGADRFETAALIADAIAEATPTAVMARADIYPDALTGAYEAANNDDAPILLTRSDDLPQTTIDALEDNNVDNVVLLGGTAAINTGVENELEGLGYNVVRRSGPTRYHTAIAIAEAGGTIGTIDGERSALVASGENFPDALSGSPLSFAAFLPSLLVPADMEDGDAGVEAILRSYVDDVIDSLDGMGVENVFLIGGPAAVGEDVEDELTSAGFTVSRLAGANRGATSVQVFEFGMEEGIYTNRRFGLARGDTFPDALAYAPLAGRARATVAPNSGVADTGGASNGLLLANGTCDLLTEVEAFIAEHSDTWTQGEILGGPEAICSELAAEVDQLASAGFAGITVNETSSGVGGTITGNVQGEDISTVTVSGCGFSNQAVTRDADGDFTLTLPASQTTDCTLVFTTTFTDGRTETDSFPIDLQAPGDPNATLSPTSGVSGTTVTSSYSGARPADITDVNSTNCTIGSEGTQTQGRTFTVSGADNTTCQIQTVVTFTDSEGGTQTLTDTFTVTPPGTTPPPGSTGTGVSSGTPLATDAPDLTRTDIVTASAVVGDGAPNVVRFTFDERVSAVGPVTGYSVQGFDSATFVAAGAANVDTGDASGTTVLAEFPDATDLTQFTIGTANGGSAMDIEVKPNVLASRALGGSTAASGRTAKPDLISATKNSAPNTITYTFDQPITPGTPAQFGFFDANGIHSVGDGFASTGPNAVTVMFTLPAEDVDNAVRFYAGDSTAAEDGVAGVTGTGGVGDNPIGHTGIATNAPDLTSVTQVPGQNQFLFNFDEDIDVVPGLFAEFGVYNPSGTRSSGTAAAVESARVVRVTFGGLTPDQATQVVVAGVENETQLTTDAPVTADVGGEENSVGAVPVTGRPASAGFTDGPDLLGATYQNATDQVVFTFDENISTAPLPVEGNFFLVDRSGTVIAVGIGGSSFVNGSTVRITFPAGTVQLAAGSGVTSTTGTQPPGAGAPAGNAAFDTEAPPNQNSPDSVGGGPAPGV